MGARNALRQHLAFDPAGSEQNSDDCHRSFPGAAAHERRNGLRIRARLPACGGHRSAARSADRVFAADRNDVLSDAGGVPDHSESGDRADIDRLARHRDHVKSSHRVCDFILSHHGRYDHRTAVVATGDHLSCARHGRDPVSGVLACPVSQRAAGDFRRPESCKHSRSHWRNRGRVCEFRHRSRLSSACCKRRTGYPACLRMRARFDAAGAGVLLRDRSVGESVVRWHVSARQAEAAASGE